METGIGIVIFLVGAIFGVIVGVWRVKALTIGTLRIAHSDESVRPYLFVELDTPIEMFESKECVLMKVKPEYYSQN